MYINTFEECKEIIDKEEEVYIVNERISFIKSERLDKIIKDFDFENLVSKYKN